METKLAGLYLSGTKDCNRRSLRVELKYQDALELLTCLQLELRARKVSAQEIAV